MTPMTILKAFIMGLNELDSDSEKWLIWKWQILEEWARRKENDYTAGHTKFWQDDGRDKFFLAKKTSRLKALSYE